MASWGREACREIFPTGRGHISLDCTLRLCLTGACLLAELDQHEHDQQCGDRVTSCGNAGARALAALDDLHRAVDLRRRAAVAVWLHPSDGRVRPHLYFEPDR